MLQALTQHAGSSQAKVLFDGMQERDNTIWNTVLNAYALEESLELAEEILAKMPLQCKFSWTIMLLAYARASLLDKAKQLFDVMAERDVVSWNALIQASAESGLLEKVVILFDRVPQCNMSSCNSTLVAYVQCGYLDQAHKLFARIPDRDLASWSIMILGCAGNRQERLALEHFGEMLLEGIKCDEITMLGVLSACNHLGLIQEGVSYFVMMVAELGIDPFVEHFSSLVDLLARVGQLREAHDLLRNMPFVPDPAACCSMLGACRTHGDVELGAYTAANEEFGIEPHHPSPYLFLSSMKH
ncbi:pentatricopeptide repeat-containing protein At4g02750 [Selaginella moellendorffii]|uniref:pentatricopeptide repeat-containing protein At4g02750 n=1 Tax=Selaginella moellendorffii TaxID=88036 RepID=UPI000D1C5BD9|nr:pentatricopeptide repeat-containing protein At4g02750 [Selaginella moellendorffii]|eukprot:XP_024522106.1 pentatricopeptide repeat-containing protein At4g02750 [Selaginella moellendorffii]